MNKFQITFFESLYLCMISGILFMFLVIGLFIPVISFCEFMQTTEDSVTLGDEFTRVLNSHFSEHQNVITNGNLISCTKSRNLLLYDECNIKIRKSSEEHSWFGFLKGESDD